MPENFTNVPQNTSLGEFWAEVSASEGFIKGSKYLVRINAPPLMATVGWSQYFNRLGFFCEMAELPGKTFENTRFRYYGPDFKMPHQTLFEDTSFTFLCTETGLERRLFDSWMENINPSNSYDFRYRDEYATTVEIYQMSDIATANNTATQQARYKIVLEKAYPIGVNAQQVTWADDNFLRLNVTFTYTRWVREAFMDPPPAASFKLVGSDIQNSLSPLPYFLLSTRTANQP